MIRTIAAALSLFLFLIGFELHSDRHAVDIEKKDPPFINDDKAAQRWVDSVFNKLTPDQRLGQLFMVAAYSNKGAEEKQRIAYLINTYNIGGLIFMQGGPLRQASLNNYYQNIAKVPLMIGMDAEWGLSMRLDSTPNFGRQLLWGAVSDDQLIYKTGLEIARECKRLGVHVSFSPVVDVNNNPRNPVIGDRSFGELKENVARKGIAYMQGLQDGGVLASAKHFPGHGDTDQDSHKTLPTITASRERLDSLELYPFRALINAGVGSVMVAHLNIPALDTTPKRASTLSPNIVQGLLKDEMGFKGLVFTDALNMQGVADYNQPGEVDAKALVAGNDVLLFSGNVGEAIKQIKQAVKDSLITQEEVNARVKKILLAKHWLGLTKKQFVPMTGLYKELFSDEAVKLQQELMAEALTLVRTKDNLIPFNTKLDTFRFASVSIGAFKETPFQTVLSRYTSVKKFSIDKQASKEDFVQLVEKLKPYNTVFISLHNLSRSVEADYGITDNAKLFVDEIQKNKTTVLTVFGTPYAVKFFDNIPNVQVAYVNDSVAQRLAAQALFAGLPMRGKLPVTASPYSKAGTGVTTGSTRIRYQFPPNDQKTQIGFNRIDSLLRSYVRRGAFPGANVTVLKDGNVIYNGAVGYHTYDNTTRVSDTSVYDIASVTKTTSTTLAVMRLYEQNKLKLDGKLGDYLSWVKGSDKEDIVIRDLLLHEAGLKAWIPFYKNTLQENSKLREDVYAATTYDGFKIPVANDVFMNITYLDSIKAAILASPKNERGYYLYSDLDFIFLGWVVEAITGVTLDQYVQREFYGPMGLQYTFYNPLNRLNKKQVVPSNYDYTFRKQLIQGYVHDPGAAMMGGVAGHAGLFSTGLELGMIYQMLVNYGEYGGVKYFEPATVGMFTTRYGSDSRRGLGFDKMEPDEGKPSPCCEAASTFTFGHQGFTGTCVWADPANNLVFVFLSNRTFPDEGNGKINSLSVRSTVQQEVYAALGIDTTGLTKR